MAAERHGRALVGRRDRLHHAVQRQDHERQQDVRHRDIHADAVEQQRQRMRDQPGAEQRLVDQPLALQQHDPRGHAHQHRGPERNQHEDHHEVRAPLRQRRDPVCERIAEQQREQRDRHADHERAAEDRQVDRLVGVGRHDVAEAVLLVVERGEQVERRIRAAVLRDRLPVRNVAPARVELDELVAHLRGCQRRVVVAFQRHRARRLRDQRPVAGNLGVQAARERAHRVAVGDLRHVGRERGVCGVGRRRLAVPVRERGDRIRQRGGDLGVLHRAREQRADRHDEDQQHEQRERRDQQQRHRALAGLGGLQLALERGARRCGRSDRHRIQQSVSGRTAIAVRRPLHQDADELTSTPMRQSAARARRRDRSRNRCPAAPRSCRCSASSAGSPASSHRAT
ncbi:hypothetical protein FEQ05_02148 [Burkholderia pseudomultivorans]|nr:hypothetical protein [Burkholderia pseudomultivorans]